MTKVSPGQRDADNLHAGWSPQLSDVFAFSMNTEVFVLSQTWISLLSLAFALPPFLPIPFFFWSNQTFWFGQESNWKTILKEKQSTQLYPAQPFVRHLPQLQHHWRAICPQPEVSPFLQISTNITEFQIHKQANRNKRTSYCRLREEKQAFTYLMCCYYICWFPLNTEDWLLDLYPPFISLISLVSCKRLFIILIRLISLGLQWLLAHRTHAILQGTGRSL